MRFVTAASLFDGHDAAINVMRRLIQGNGAEVVHLGHNRSVRDVVRAAVQEDVDGIAIESGQLTLEPVHMAFNLNLEGVGLPSGDTIPPDFFHDVRVRRAFNLAFDYDAMVNELRQHPGILAVG